MKKAVKFGGSSLADATQFRKCAAIIQADPSRRYVVPSAPGKRFRDDVKITDMLIECYEIQRKDLDQGLECFSRVEDRFDEIIRDLGLDYSLEPEYRLIRSYMEEGLSRDYLVSRGEFLSGKVLAALLGFPFVDPADYIVFNSNGVFEEQKTAAAFRKIVDMDCFVMPGFYGATETGRIKTFTRGGSDITGSVVAGGMRVDIYENWTDVSGFLMADPRMVEDPLSITEISYSELRELSYMGAQVFHEEAIFPAREAGIPINIRNTNRPEDEGSWVRTDDKISEGHLLITGVTGKKGFMSMSFEKDVGGDRLPFGRKVLQMFEEAKIMVEHVPSSIGTMTVIVDAREISGKEENILRRIRREIDPYSITVERNLALVAVVGIRMHGVVGITSDMLRVLAKEGINVRMLIQGIKEISLIIGINEEDFEKAIRLLYRFALERNQKERLG